MSSDQRRAKARRRAWGRGPMILRFEPLEGRQLLSGAGDAGSTAAPDTNITTVVSSPAPTDGAAVSTTTAVDSASDTNPGTSTGVTPHSTPVTTDTGTPTADAAAEAQAPLSATTTTATSTDAAAAVAVTSTATPTTSTAVNAPIGQPDLTIAGFDTAHNLDWGQAFHARGTLRNDGTAPVPAGVKVDVYASPVPQLGPSAVYVGTAVVADAIPPGGTVPFDAPMLAPPQPLGGLGSAPSYYIIPRADGDGTIAESNEANNGGEPAGPTSVVTITPQPRARLEATAFLATPNTLNWGQSITIKTQITNDMPGSVAPATRARIVLYPKGQSATGPAAVTIGEIAVPSMTAYPPANLQTTIKLPDTPPAVLATSSTFSVSVIPDADFLTATPLSSFLGHGNGRDTATVTILPGKTPLPVPTRAEVSVVKLQPVTDTATWGQPLQVRATLENDGTADAANLRVRFTVIDANRPLSAPLAISDTVLSGIPAGYKQDILHSISLQGALPANVDPATINPRVIVTLDPENSVDESNELNNQLVSGPIKFKLLAREDTTPKPATPGPITTAPQQPTHSQPTTPGSNGPKVTSPTVRPTTPPGPQRMTRLQQWRQHQAQLRAERMAAHAERRARWLQLRANQPRLRIARGTAQLRVIDHGGKIA